MASSSYTSISLAFLALALSLAIPSTLGAVICEELPQDVCAFSISSAGKRCLLENSVAGGGLECKTSEVMVQKMAEYIENDQCVKACGVDRGSIGISSDSLMEPQFTRKLCSADCYQNCPNIVDLYFNLAAGEGVFLPELCQVQRSNPRRAMAELLSSGAAMGPVSEFADFIAAAPAPI